MAPKLPSLWWAAPASFNQSAFYALMANALLGVGVRPFSGFVAPPDMRAAYWYGSVFATSHHDVRGSSRGMNHPRDSLLACCSFMHH